MRDGMRNNDKIMSEKRQGMIVVGWTYGKCKLLFVALRHKFITQTTKHEINQKNRFKRNADNECVLCSIIQLLL